MAKWRIFWLLAILPLVMTGQSLPEGMFLKGYERSVRGGGFGYHSPQPDVTSSLLIRSIDSAQYIEWTTQRVPDGSVKAPVRFIWIFGIDANPDSHRFRLSVNDRYCLTFSNPVTSDKQPWLVEGQNGASLLFRPTLIDKYGDPMGYAVLSVPQDFIKSGMEQHIRISGESKESRSWYMTFEAGVEEQSSIAQIPALVRTNNGAAVPVRFRFVHPGEPVPGCTLAVDDQPPVAFDLATGYSEVPVLVPEAKTVKEHKALIAIPGQEKVNRTFTVEPPPHLTVYLVQHTHTDIGYTRPQTEILPDHLRYIDYALDFCDLTDSLPDDARFRWTCETSWAVREYLRTRPAKQVERLRKRVAEGRIELTALFLNGSDLADEAISARTLQPVREMRELGFTVKAAMQSDINGVPWCLADYLPAAGIRYLNMAQNTHRAEKPFELPTTFWWESPAGNRLMVNRPEHYMWANSLGILTGRETFADGLFKHLADIRSKGYPFDHYAIQFSGYLTDNSPPSTTACKVVEEWNKTYLWPHLRLATLSEFMDWAGQNVADKLQVVKGAWPDWWMDGFGSAAIQTAYARSAHSDYIANGGLLAMALARGIGIPEAVKSLQAEITDDIAFYDEHTFGAAESITDPLVENSVVQLGEKEAYVWSAVKKNRILREEIMGRIQPLVAKAGVPTVTVFNTLGQKRSGNALVYIDHQLLPKDRTFTVLGPAGDTLPCQLASSREEGSWWMIGMKNIPSFGWATCRIVTDAKPVNPKSEMRFTGTLENQFYRIAVDPATGRITSLFDKFWKRELADTGASASIGEVIYERLGKNRGQLEQHRLDEYTRTVWEKVNVRTGDDGPIFQSIILNGQMEGCADPSGIRCEIRLYRNEKKVEFRYSMKKLAVTDPEAVYVAFPFALKPFEFEADVTGGTMQPGKTQLRGSATDWFGIQDFVALKGNGGRILFSSPEIPLIHPGAINLGKFRRLGVPEPLIKKDSSEPFPSSAAIYSWVLNNYWTTNFLASQEGELKWSYQLTSGAEATGPDPESFGQENRVPFLFRVFPASSDTAVVPSVQSCIPWVTNGVTLLSAFPASTPNGVVFQFRETAGPSTTPATDEPVPSFVSLADLKGVASVSEIDVLEEAGKTFVKSSSSGRNESAVNPRIVFHPHETKFILVTYNVR